jgi:hypothetical protein
MWQQGQQHTVNLDDDDHHDVERRADNDYRTVVDLTVGDAHREHAQSAPDRRLHPASGSAPAAVHNAPESGLPVLITHHVAGS